MSDVNNPLDPKTLALRPLDKGMFTDIPPQMIPTGGGRLVENLHVKSDGLVMREGQCARVSQPLHNELSLTEEFTDLFQFANASGTRNLFGLTKNNLVKIDIEDRPDYASPSPASLEDIAAFAWKFEDTSQALDQVGSSVTPFPNDGSKDGIYSVDAEEALQIEVTPRNNYAKFRGYRESFLRGFLYNPAYGTTMFKGFSCFIKPLEAGTVIGESSPWNYSPFLTIYDDRTIMGDTRRLRLEIGVNFTNMYTPTSDLPPTTYSTINWDNYVPSKDGSIHLMLMPANTSGNILVYVNGVFNNTLYGALAFLSYSSGDFPNIIYELGTPNYLDWDRDRTVWQYHYNANCEISEFIVFKSFIATSLYADLAQALYNVNPFQGVAQNDKSRVVPLARKYPTTQLVNGSTSTITIPNSEGYDFFTDGIKENMQFFWYSEAAGIDVIVRRVLAIEAGAHSYSLTLDSAITIAKETDYREGFFYITPFFNPTEPFPIAYCNIIDGYLFSDCSEQGFYKLTQGYVLVPWVFETQNSTESVPDYSAAIGARCLMFMQGRIMLAGTYEPTLGGIKPQRIRWSGVANTGLLDTRDYADFVMSQGEIVSLARLEDFPVVFLEDGIYFGQINAAVYTDSPWLWRRIDTGGISICGPKAVCSGQNGLFFAGKTDMFMLNTAKTNEKGDFSLIPMNCPIYSQVRQSSFMRNLVAFYDTEHDGIAITVPTSNSFVSNIVYIFYFQTKAWAKHVLKYPFSAMTSLLTYNESLTWGEATGTWSDAKYYLKTWKDRSEQFFSRIILFIAKMPSLLTSLYSYNRLACFSKDISTDTYLTYSTSSSIERVGTFTFETQDLDLDFPDNEKTFTKFGFRFNLDLDFALSNSRIVWTLSASNDRGRSYKPLGTVFTGEHTIVPAPFYETHRTYEEELNFRMSGSAVRFKLVATFTTPEDNAYEPLDLKVEEVTLRALIRGVEVSRGR